MSRMILRKRIPINYFEPDDVTNLRTPLDEYIHCDKCGEFVYEYCSLHGPLLVIPDDKVPEPTSQLSLPRAAYTIPQVFLHLATSTIPGAGLGVFSSLTLPTGVRFGPYKGSKAAIVESVYCWQIHRDNKPAHVVDASDAAGSNWLRFVNCARHWREQNLVAYQYRGQIYYRTIKTIPRFTELLVFYGQDAASTLKINLSRYNSEEHYEQIVEQNSTELPERNLQYIEKNHTEFENNELYQMTFTNHHTMDVKSNDDSMICYGDSNQEISVENITFIDDQQPEETIMDCMKKRIHKKSSTSPSKNSISPVEYSCEICLKTFCNLYSLKRHRLSHKTEFGIPTSLYERHLHQCDICAYPFESFNNLLRHKLNKHIEKTCPICKKTTFALRRHISRHLTVKKYNCNLCIFKTDFANTFDTHLRVHMKDKGYKCNDCSYSTLRRDCITRHVKIHLGKISHCL